MVGGTGKNALNKLSQGSIESFRRNAEKGKLEKRIKLADGGGLYLTVTAAGTPVWRIKYRFGGDERSYTVGPLAAYSPDDARTVRDTIKALVREGRDPVDERRLKRAAAVTSNSAKFEDLVNEWLAIRKPGWSTVHHEKSKRALERDVLPTLGRLPVGAIREVMVCSVIEAIVRRGSRDTAQKVLQHVRAVFALGKSRGLVKDNPAEAVAEVIPPAKLQRRRPALLTFPALGAVLRGAETAHLTPAVRMAHRLLAFAPGVRITNVVEARWTEFDLDADIPVWLIPRAQMKRKHHEHDHKVVLCPRIAQELRDWQRVSAAQDYVFPSPAGGEHISPEALEKAYRETLQLRDKHCPHGWRSAFSTLAKDHGFRRDVVELALDHVHDNDVVRAYDRGERLKHRVKLMQWWGEELHAAQLGAEVFQLRKAG